MKAKKIIASILMIASLVSVSAIPAYAVTDYQSSSNFWQWVADGTGGIPQKVLGYVTGDAVCPDSEDGKHHASSALYDRGNGHYACTCAYCGESYTATKTDISNAYTDTVDDMQFKSIDSDGGFLWYPTSYDLVSNSLRIGNGTYRNIPYSYSWEGVKDDLPYIFSEIVTSGHVISYSLDSNSYTVAKITFASTPVYLKTTIAGTYTLVSPVKMSIDSLYGSDFRVGDTSYSAHANANDYVSFPMPSSPFVPNSNNPNLTTSLKEFSGSIELPVYRVVTDEPMIGYEIDSRPVSITGDYSVVGDNNEVFVHDETLFDESTNTFYNPISGDTTVYESWTYDYSTRTYTMNDGEGGETTLTYGDDNIVINDGGNTFNLYYGNVSQSGGSNNGSGAGDSDDSTGLLSQVGRLLGTLVSGLLGGITAFLSAILGALTRLVEVIGDGFTNIIQAVLGWFAELPALFAGFLEFLGAVFSFLPTEIITLLTFGIAAVVFVGIIKAVRR